MTGRKLSSRVATLLVAVCSCALSTHASDIGGTISSTLTMTGDSQLVDDVICTVVAAPCIAIGASHVTLSLNGFTITGQADPQIGCSGAGTGGENGIDVNTQAGVQIRGPGLVKQFRGFGVRLQNSTGATVTDVTVSTSCFSGIFVSGGSDHILERNVAVRNGHGTNPCGGIWILGGSSRNRVRANRLSGNGYAAQGNNFGIGLENVGTNDNIVEDNTVIGNSNGLFMTAGVQGNIIRRNLLEGNPPVQIAVDHAANTGFDIKNLEDTGANTFVGNICATSVNAPCPSLGPSITASPNPILITGSAAVGSTTISWNAPGVNVIEIRIGKPDGQLFTRMGNRGSIETGTWVSDGMTFYLQDVSGGRPLTSDYTLAAIVVHLQRSNSAAVYPGRQSHGRFGSVAILLGAVLGGMVLLQSRSRRKSVRVVLAVLVRTGWTGGLG